MRHWIQKFRKQEEGATAIEFAVVCVPLFMLLFAVIEFGVMYSTMSILESSTQRVAREQKALAGTTDSDGAELGNISANEVRNKIVENSNNFLHFNRLVIAADDLSDSTGCGASGGTQGGWGSAVTVDGSGNMIGSNNRTSGGQTASQLTCGSTGGASTIVQYRVYYTHHYLIPALGRLMTAFYDAEPADEGIVLQTSTVVQNEPPLVRP